MSPALGHVRRLFTGRAVAVALGALLLGWAVTSVAFLPAYVAIAVPTALRNLLLPWVGHGVVFYAIALLTLYLEAVVLAAFYHGAEAVYRAVEARRSRGRAT